MNGLLAAIDSVRNRAKALMTVIARVLNKATRGHLPPSAITAIGLFMHLVIAWLIIEDRLLLSGFLLIFFGLFDALDGALARLQGSTSAKGMFLDSVTDRMKEVVLYPAVGYNLIANGDPYGAVWAIVACGASILVSYTNAWGEVALTGQSGTQAGHAKNKSFRTGLMTFDVRMALLAIGLLFNQLLPVVIIIAIGAIFTAISRLNFVLNKLDSDA